jgi:hypothetical protein
MGLGIFFARNDYRWFVLSFEGHRFKQIFTDMLDSDLCFSVEICVFRSRSAHGPRPRPALGPWVERALWTAVADTAFAAAVSTFEKHLS